MEFAKLGSSYYEHDAMMRAGEPAETLYTRALAYCQRVENDGFVSREILPRLTPLRGAARARALVKEGIFVVVPGGWRIQEDWWRQVTKAEIEAKRRGGKERQARHRSRIRDGVTGGVSNASPSRREEEVEEEPAAAAAGDPAAAAALAGPIDVLRAKLQAHTPLRALRFDDLKPDVATRILALIDLHGDDPLVRVAIDTCRNPPPVHVGAFLGTWEALPEPGTRHLGVVRPQVCDTHGTQLSPSGACSSCAADKKAGHA